MKKKRKIIDGFAVWGLGIGLLTRTVAKTELGTEANFAKIFRGGYASALEQEPGYRIIPVRISYEVPNARKNRKIR